MIFTNQVIGAKLLESITSGLYDGNLNCIREYVQNAIDNSAKNISISLEMGGQNLVIRDDGSGMNEQNIERALSLGISDKDESMVGWRGIGIWSGVPACQRLVIVTKERNGNKLRVEINNENIRKYYESNISILDVLSQSIDGPNVEPLGKDESLLDTHFTEIRLESILPTQISFFQEQSIKQYLQKVVPAPFNEEKFKHSIEIDNWLNINNVCYSMSNIQFNGEKIFRAPFEDDYYLSEVIKPIFYDQKGMPIAIGWLVLLNQRKDLKWPKTGVLFKKKGFTIGDEHFIKQFFTDTYHQWQYGEIHIISDDIRENASRNNFEYNYGNVQDLINQIKEHASDWENVNRYRVDRGKMDKVEKVESLVESGDVREADKELKKIKEILERKARSFPKNEYLAPVKKMIDSETEKKTSYIPKLSEKIDEIKKTPEISDKKAIKDLIYKLTDQFPKEIRDEMKRVRKGHETDIVISSIDPIQKLIEKKTGLKEKTFHDLSKKAFGWNDIPQNGEPLLTIDKNKHLNRRFGILLYTIHDLFDNKYKHEKGLESFEWYTGASEEEKLLMIFQLKSIYFFCYKMIERAEIN